ncbi:MAG: NADH-quinone oxidoreductase subunit C/D [Opitutales bacterium]|nr:NADH-quinone oxidoreductase subunit C/D [Opitutales bacterium]
MLKSGDQTSLSESPVLESLRGAFGEAILKIQSTCDGIPTVWIRPGQIKAVLKYLKHEAPQRFAMLYDLSAIDERTRQNRNDQPESDFTVFYQLLQVESVQHLRLKVPLEQSNLLLPSITDLWPAADWYEREVWDMFGIRFDGHPNLRRILMPPTWKGHPLRKDHPARATEMGPFSMPTDRHIEEEEALQFKPEEWGMERESDESEFMFLNIGPQHPGTHGVIRFVLQLDGEEIVDVVPDIGYHHRGAEKMGERQSWHTFIPYTDRIDYLSGVLNNLPYVMAVEKLAGIQVPQRAQVIRVMLCELFRISNHLVWYGTYAQDVGQLSPVFYMFTDREKLLGIIEAICGARMHPNWLRIGGVAADLPKGWDSLVREFVDYMPAKLREYDAMVMDNYLLKARTRDIGAYTTEEAIEWGITGPGLRATGMGWDLRKEKPYSGYEQFEFEVPIAHKGDCYDRAVVRVAEMRESLKIIRQCLDYMPTGPIKADHPLTTPQPKERTMQDIETLITHFLGVSWGPVIPEGEAMGCIEGSKGLNSYYVISEKSTIPYRVRIRTPSFTAMQFIPPISRGHMIPDLLAIIGATDFVLADVDR